MPRYPTQPRIKIFADGADLAKMWELAGNPLVAGFTTNPTLLRKAGVADYSDFAREALRVAGLRPVSFEVFADEFPEMQAQATKIASWGDSAYVKIPVTNTRGESSAPLIHALSMAGVPLNVTAVFTEDQVLEVAEALAAGEGPAVVSVFAGRVADTGVDPREHMQRCRIILRGHCLRAELLWASPRQAFDVILASHTGCDIITMTPDLIAKVGHFGRNLTDYSRETVQMFYDDAQAAGYQL